MNVQERQRVRVFIDDRRIRLLVRNLTEDTILLHWDRFHHLSLRNSSSGTRCILFTALARTNRKLDNLLMYGSTSGLIDSTFERATILLSALLHTALATWSSAPGTLPPGSMNLRRRGSPEFNSSVTLSSLSSCSRLIRGTFAVTSWLAKSPPRIHRSLWMPFRVWSNFFPLICALAAPT